MAKLASLNAHSSTYYTGLFLYIVLDRPLASIKRCCMAFACLHISDIVFFCELSVILLAFRSQIEQTYGKAIATVFGSCRPVSDLEQNRVLDGLHAGQLVLRKSILSPTRPPTTAKGAAASKREILIPSVRMNCCFRAYLGQMLLRTFE